MLLCPILQYYSLDYDTYLHTGVLNSIDPLIADIAKTFVMSLKIHYKFLKRQNIVCINNINNIFLTLYLSIGLAFPDDSNTSKISGKHFSKDEK